MGKRHCVATGMSSTVTMNWNWGNSTFSYDFHWWSLSLMIAGTSTTERNPPTPPQPTLKSSTQPAPSGNPLWSSRAPPWTHVIVDRSTFCTRLWGPRERGSAHPKVADTRRTSPRGNNPPGSVAHHRTHHAAPADPWADLGLSGGGGGGSDV